MKLFGMGTPPPAPHSPVVRLSEQTLCSTNIQIEWQSVSIDGEASSRGHDVYPVHLYRLQRQEHSHPVDRLIASGSMSSSLSSPLSAGIKWVTVYEGTDTTCFDQIYTPPVRSTDENASGMLGQISVIYRLSSWNVIGRSDHSHLRYEITRPTVSSWSELSGRDECLDQPTTPQFALSSTELRLIALDTHQQSERPNSVQTSPHRQNASPEILQTQGDEDPSDPLGSWSLSSLFSFFFQLLWLLWTIYSTCRAWLWTALSILSVPLTLLYLYLRFNPPGVDTSSYSSHWLRSPALKSFVKSSCLFLIRMSQSFSDKFPSTKATAQALIQFLETVASNDPRNSAPRSVVLTPSTLRQHRILKRMNSGRSIGDDSADSQHSGSDETKGCPESEKCHICSRPFKLQVSFPKIKWRVKHHCCVCLNLFCSKCGVVTHANVQCPVRGTCCCQNCSDALHHHKEGHRGSESQSNSPSAITAASNHLHCDETSSVGDSIDGEHQPQPEKKKHRSFASLKDFGINLGKRPAADREKQKKSVFIDSTAPSGIPPRPSPPSTSSVSQTTKKINWPSIPSLGRRVTSSPPAINSDRSPCASPPEITSSVSWPLAGEDIHTEEYFERLSN
jgi:hypothetical protein